MKEESSQQAQDGTMSVAVALAEPPSYFYPSISLPPRPSSFKPILTTARLTLTLVDSRDEVVIAHCINTSNYAGGSHANFNHGVDTPEKWNAKREATQLLPKYTPLKQPLSGLAVYIVRLGPDDPAGEPVGVVLLTNRDEDLPPELGWSIFSAHQRKGYASEASARLMAYFRDEFQGGFANANPHLLAMIAILSEQNAGSVGVAKRLDMIKLGSAAFVYPKLEGESVYGFPAEDDKLVGEEWRKMYQGEPAQIINVLGVGEKGLDVIALYFGPGSVDQAWVEEMKRRRREIRRR
jgi:RimJ/RimL family protein N-acetyltransferase